MAAIWTFWMRNASSATVPLLLLNLKNGNSNFQLKTLVAIYKYLIMLDGKNVKITK